MSGLLVVKPVSAKLRRDTETFGKMDPYCRVKCGSSRCETKVHHNGGKFPAWNDTLSFKKTNETLLTVEIWDQDTVNDDLVGECTIPLANIVQAKKSTEWYTLSYKGKNAGEVLIEFDYRADNVGQPIQFNNTQPSMMMSAGTGAQPFNPVYGVTYMLPQMYMQQQPQPVYGQPQPVFTPPPQTMPQQVYTQPMMGQPTYTQPMGQPTYVQGGSPTFVQGGSPTYGQPIVQPMGQQAYGQPQYTQQQPQYTQQQMGAPSYAPTQQMGQQTYSQQQPLYGQPQSQPMMQNQGYPQQGQQMAPQGQQFSYAPPGY